MEVKLVPGKGPAIEHAVLSVKVGGIRKQAPATSECAMGFPEAANQTRFTVDLYQHVGTGYIVHKPSHGESRPYKVEFGDTGLECELQVRSADGNLPQDLQSGTTGGVGNTAAARAKEYLEAHRVPQLMKSLMEILVKERPADPFIFMARHLLNGYDDHTRAEAIRTKGDMASSTEPAPPPPRPAGMTHPESVTLEMMQRQWHEPEKWSMSLDQLLGVLDHCTSTDIFKQEALKSNQGAEDASFSMYQVNETFVKPWSKGTGCGISVLTNPDQGLPAQLMLSHAWGEDVNEFTEALRIWQTENRVPGSLRVWFCLFANYQCEDDEGPDIPFQIGLKPIASVIESEAVKIENGGRGMLAVHTTTCDLYKRLWCVHEVARAITTRVMLQAALSEKYTECISRQVTYILSVGGTYQSALDAAGVTVNIARAECSRDEDRKMLVEQTVNLEGQFHHVDLRVCDFRKRALPADVLYKLAEAGMRLHSVDEYGNDLAVALLFCGRLVAERFAMVSGALKDDLTMDMLACKMLRSGNVASLITALWNQADPDCRPFVRGEDEVIFAAMEAIGCMDASAVSWLVDREKKTFWAIALKALGRKGVPEMVARALMERFEDRDGDIRAALATVVGSMAAGVPPKAAVALIEQLMDDCNGVRHAAASLIRRLDDNKGQVRKAIGRLDDGDSHIRKFAAEALGRLGELAGLEAVGALVRRLRVDMNNDVLTAASEALQKMGELAGPGAVAAIIGRLDDDDWRVRQFAAVTLGKMGDFVGLEAVGALVRRLRVGEKKDVVTAASKALEKMGELAGPEVVAALIGWLDDDNKRVRQFAAEALGNMGELAGLEAVGALIRRCQVDTDNGVFTAASDALEKMGELAGLVAVAALSGWLGDDNWRVRQFAAEGLGKMGELAGPEAVAALIGRLDDDDWRVRQTAAEALGKMGELAGPEAALALAKTLVKRGPRDQCVSTCRDSLWRLGSHVVGTVPAFLQMLADSEPQRRILAAEVLGELGKHAPPAVVTALAERFEDPDPEVCDASTAAFRLVLEQSRFHAKTLIPSLCKGLKSESADVKCRCLRALAQAIRLARTKSKQLEEELAERLETSPQEVRQLLDRVCKGDAHAAKQLSRPPAAQQPAQGD